MTTPASGIKLAQLDALIAKMVDATRYRLAHTPTDMETMLDFMANLNHDQFDKVELSFMLAALLLHQARGRPASQP